MENYLPTESIIAIHSEKEEIIEETNRLLENNMVKMFLLYHPLLEVPKAVMKLQNVRLIWLKNTTPDYIFYT
jgi:hypothetical protein